jgi:heptosyltransferase-3
MLKDLLDFNQLKSVLIIKLRHHGDVLLTTPVFDALKQAYPHLLLDALVYLDTAPMLTLNPNIDQIHTIDRNWKRQGIRHQLRQEYRLFQTLYNRRYDLIIHLTEHHRGAILSRLLCPTYSIAPKGRKGRLFQHSFTHLFPLLKGNSRHTVDMHLDALRRLGLSLTPPPLTFIPGHEAEQKVSHLLTEHSLTDQLFLVFHPTSRWSFKTWDVAKAAELIQYLHHHHYPIVVTGAPDKSEHQFIDTLQSLCPGQFINLAGQLSLKELGALIAKAHVFLGFDSVPAHLAAAMQTPAVVLFGPSGEHEWHPWQVNHRLITAPLACRPCGQAGCGNSWKSDCLNQISAAQVASEVSSLWHG